VEFGVDEAGAGASQSRSRARRVPWEPIALLGAVVVLWHVVIVAFEVPPFLVPGPLAVLVTMQQKASLLATHGAVTLGVTVGSFLVALLLGVLGAVLVTSSRMLERFVLPLIVFSQVVPKIAIAPLLVIWLGFSIQSRVVVAFLICFFPILIGTVAGLKSVEEDLLYLTRQLRASRWRTFWMVSLPSALPHLFSGLKVAITLAIVGAIVAEWVGADSGLGYLLLVANGNFDVPLAFAILVVLTLFGVALFGLIELIEAVSLPWHVSRRLAVHE
jgi:NitT/TauT family transport system permease protein